MTHDQYLAAKDILLRTADAEMTWNAVWWAGLWFTLGLLVGRHIWRNVVLRQVLEVFVTFFETQPDAATLAQAADDLDAYVESQWGS